MIASEVPQYLLTSATAAAASDLVMTHMVDGQVIGTFLAKQVDDDPHYAKEMEQVAARRFGECRQTPHGLPLEVVAVGVDPATEATYVVCDIIDMPNKRKHCLSESDFEHLTKLGPLAPAA